MLTKQPFGNYAKTLLERQHYPDLFEYPGGPPKRPYDVTAHTLPLLFGVDVAHVMDAAPRDRRPIVKEIPEPDVLVGPLSGKTTKRIAIFRQSTNQPIDHGWTMFTLRHLQDPVHDRSPRRTSRPARRTISST